MYLISSLFRSGYLPEIEWCPIEIIALDSESHGAISGEIRVIDVVDSEESVVWIGELGIGEAQINVDLANTCLEVYFDCKLS